MSTVIGKVAAVFTASANGLVTGVNTARASLSTLQGTVEKVHGRLTMLTAIEGARLFGSLASGAANVTRSMIAMGGATAEAIDAQSKLAAKIGVPLEAFAALSQAAELAGISQDKVTGAVQRMGLALVAAQGGSEKAQAAFAAIGLSAADLAKMSPEQAFQAIAEEIAKLPTPAERTAAAIKIFGKAGRDLGPMFEGGAAAIKQATEEAYLFGTALDTASGQKVEQMNDAWTRLGKAFEGFKTQVVAAFAPAVTAGIEQLIQQLKDAGGMRQVALDFAETVGFAVVSLVEGAMQFAAILKDVLDLVKGTFNTIKNFRAFLTDMQAYGMEAAGNLEWFANRSQENETSLGFAKRARELHEESRRLWRESQGLPPLDASGMPTENESEIRKSLRENLERMRGINRGMATTATPPAEAVSGTPGQKPVSEATGQKQVTLLQQIAKAVGVSDPKVVFNMAGAVGGGG